MTDLIQDTGARENTAEATNDPQKNGSGAATSPGGGDAPRQSVADMTHGQESYAGPRDAGESDKSGGASNDSAADHDPTQNNAQTPIGGDKDPSDTASTDETGQAGVNDRPGKDKAHPWNG